MLGETFFVISAVAMALSLVGAMVVKRDLKNRLINSHPEICRKLGVSLKFEVDEPSRQKALSDFLKKKSYESLGDTKLNLLCNHYRKIGLLFYLSSFICFILAAFLLLSRTAT